MDKLRKMTSVRTYFDESIEGTVTSDLPSLDPLENFDLVDYHEAASSIENSFYRAIVEEDAAWIKKVCCRTTREE